MKQNIAIIGDGGWGTALALTLQANGHSVTVWGPFTEAIARVRADGENRAFLPGVPLPDGLEWTADSADLAKADWAVLAIPTRYFRDVIASLTGRFAPHCRFVSVAKGLEHGTLRRMSAVAADLLQTPHVAALSGPSHAEEVARGIPTAVVAAAPDAQDASDLQTLFSGGAFRVYTSEDIVGVELGGALKNVVAIAVGIADGLGFGDNTRAALITRGLAEMTRLGVAVGASPATFAGLSGMGDLIVTCTSRHSRNRGAGERIGRGEPVDTVVGKASQAIEGAWNCVNARELARRHKLDAPVTEEVHAILNEGKVPREAVRALLERDLKAET